MKTTRITAVAALIVGSGLALHVLWAQQPGIKRTDLQQHDLSVSGREVVQLRGSGNAAELATYVVEKGKPLLTLLK